MSKQLPYLDDCPLAVDIRRGGYVESTHLVDIAVVDSDGRIILGYGETERPVFPRSAMKPLQALVLVEQLQQAGLDQQEDPSLVQSMAFRLPQSCGLQPQA